MTTNELLYDKRRAYGERDQPQLGNVIAQSSFVERFRDLLSLMDLLKRTCEAADKVGPMHRDDLVMYSLVRLVIEDFNEVILLAANGTTKEWVEAEKAKFPDRAQTFQT